MSIETLEAVISQSLDIAGQEAWLCWQGGEPTLMGLDFYRKAVELEEHYRRNRQKVSNAFQTNGLLLNDDWAKFLRDNNFLVGISIDGPANFHDAYRLNKQSKPTHSLVLEKIWLLQAYDVQFNALTVVTDKNGKEPETVFEFLQNSGVNYMQFIPCLERNGKDGLMPFSVDVDDYGNFLCRMFDKWYNRGSPFYYVREYEEWFIGYVNGVNPSCMFSPYCSEAPVIEYNGDVYPCDFFVEPRLLLGNINSVSLRHILGSELYQTFRIRKQDLSERCMNCRWLQFCHGGCPKFRVNERGESIKYSYYCAAYKHFFRYSYDKFPYLEAKLGALLER